MVAQWFRGEEFGVIIVDVTRQLCDNSLHSPPEAGESSDTKAQWALLKVALCTDENMGEKRLSGLLSTVDSRYNTVIFPHNTHNKRAIARP